MLVYLQHYDVWLEPHTSELHLLMYGLIFGFQVKNKPRIYTHTHTHTYMDDNIISASSVEIF